ncbi:hypothetical protein BDZ97DRAFT_1911657 [Flammula alnicola]|nr:hypothetical protein BDZ97DRAFT_1911657 [Flammula alnicola]
MDFFFHLQDAPALQEHTQNLIQWAEDSRKHLLDIKKETAILSKEQECRNNELEAARVAAREMESKLSSCHHQEKLDLEAPLLPSTTTTRLVESSIHKVCSRFKDLDDAYKTYEKGLTLLRDDVDEARRPPSPALRPIEIDEADISNSKAINDMIYKCFVQMVDSLSKQLLHDLLDDNSVAQKALKLLEMPLRTIGLEMDRLQIEIPALDLGNSSIKEPDDVMMRNGDAVPMEF